jgi:glucokinase
MKYVLAGDIGGTRARFAIFQAGPKPKLVHHDVLESRSFRSFEAALKQFLGGKYRIAAASFGIAGPVVEQRVRTTNLPWTIDGRVVGKTFGIPNVTLLNDLVAVGLGALAAPSNKLTVIHRGRPKKTGGNVAVIAAGTGLGEATFIWDGKEHIACATEGAHVDFAPQNDVEDELLQALRSEYGHVSYERVAAGSTISKLYRFFVDQKRMKETKEAGAYIARAEDANVAVVELAESGKSRAATHAIELWARVYGAETGNLALKCLSTAGIYVCGGVSTRLAPVLAKGLRHRTTSTFIEGYLDKGRMRPVVEAIPIAICTEPRAGLLGAASHALGRC